ncbi:MAG: cytochrome c biogenesis protein CcdA [Planctomycetota bacterium]
MRAVRWLGLILGLILVAGESRLLAQESASGTDRVEPPVYQGTGEVQYRAWIPRAILRPGDEGELNIQLKIQPPWKIYGLTSEGGLPMSLTLVTSEGVEAAEPAREPEVEESFDPTFQANVTHHKGEPLFVLPFRVSRAARPGALRIALKLGYQACDATQCKLPEEVELAATVTIESLAGGTGAVAESSAPPQPPETSPEESPVTMQPAIVAGAAETPASQSLWKFLAIAFGLGILALGTPCVFPMIPITVSFFTKQAESGGRPVAMATMYSLGIVIFFTGLGMILSAALGGTGAMQFAGNPWVNLFIAALFIVFALALFGLFEIQLPDRFVNYFQHRSMTGGRAAAGYVGVVFMALAFAMTSFSCTAPFVGVLLVAAAQGEWFRPLLGMAGFSAGLALPFFFLALFPQYLQRLPKSGGWLNAVKVCMGFVVLAATFKFLASSDQGLGLGILTRPLVLAFWVGIFFVMGLYLLGKVRLPHDYDPIEQIGVVRLLFAVGSLALALFFGSGLMGYSLGPTVDALLPPPDYGGVRPLYAVEAGEQREPQWFASYDEARAKAIEQGRRLFLDFTGHTCASCKAMESGVFPDPRVRKLLSELVLAKLYTDRRDENERRNAKLLVERYGQGGVPYYVVIDPVTEEVTVPPRGFTPDPEEFARFLQQGLAGAG